MGAVRLAIVLAVAAVAALALALLVRSMTAAHKPPPAPVVAQAPEKPMTRVLVAKHDLKVADRINFDNVGWQPWPSETVNPAYITGGIATTQPDLAAKATNVVINVERGDAVMQSLSGSLVREPILANEPITQGKLVRGDGSFMAVKLPAGMRAMSIPITAESDAGGFVLPGDRVDVVLTGDIANQNGGAPTPQRKLVSSLVVQNVRVLGVDQNANPTTATPTIARSTTLEVSLPDAQKLALAAQAGTLSLALRKTGSTDIEPARLVMVSDLGPSGAPVALRGAVGGFVRHHAHGPGGGAKLAANGATTVVNADAAAKINAASDSGVVVFP